MHLDPWWKNRNLNILCSWSKENSASPSFPYKNIELTSEHNYSINQKPEKCYSGSQNKKKISRLSAYQMKIADFFRNAHKHAWIPLAQGNIKYMVPMFFSWDKLQVLVAPSFFSVRHCLASLYNVLVSISSNMDLFNCIFSVAQLPWA